MGVIPITSDEHWHRLRSQNVGGSEVAALFGRSPWITAFTLWHEKAGNVGARNFTNDRTDWGKRLEAGIADGVTADMRWTLRKSREYHTDDLVNGMGCTLDYDIVDHIDGPGVLEIKYIAEWATWKTDWTEARAPACYELQLQHQLDCTERPWGAIAVFIGQTATLKIYERKANPRVIGEIRRRVTEFWDSITDERAPDAVGTPDEWEALRELYPDIEPEKVITVPDERISEVAQMWMHGHDQRKAGEDIEKRSKTILLSVLGDAAYVRLPHYIVRQRPHGKNGRVITVIEAETGVQHTVMTDAVELA